ncbi:MAG: hypothetical protein H0U41_06735 [Actinobacteria bacterium]|nr:hypothetical protein [Actinomycetota bacterium]
MSLIAPQTLPGGRQEWLDPEVMDFVERLRILDDRLALTLEPDGRWIIWRVLESGEGVCIMRSNPGANLGPQVIEMLKMGDTRYNDPIGDAIKHNERVQKEHETKAIEERAEVIDNLMSKAWRGKLQ